MRSTICFCFCVLLTNAPSDLPAADPLGGMQLLEGYKHVPLQGIDSIVGEIKKEGGLKIVYDIGPVPKPGQPRLGGSFTDRPKNTPAKLRRWYREQTVNNQPVHLAYLKDHTLLVSYPEKGVNFSTAVKTPDEMAEALLMILTYPNPVEMDDPEPKK